MSIFTACRFAEKARFSAHLWPGGAVPRLAFCLFHRRNAHAPRTQNRARKRAAIPFPNKEGEGAGPGKEKPFPDESPPPSLQQKATRPEMSAFQASHPIIQNGWRR